MSVTGAEIALPVDWVPTCARTPVASDSINTVDHARVIFVSPTSRFELVCTKLAAPCALQRLAAGIAGLHSAEATGARGRWRRGGPMLEHAVSYRCQSLLLLTAIAHLASAQDAARVSGTVRDTSG